MLEFGHQCLDEGNWGIKLPFVLIDAHVALSQYATDPNLYFRDDRVWGDIYTVYSTYVRIRPDDAGVKNYYCHYACLCGQWKVANQLFQEIGDKAVPAAFGGEAKMKEFKKRAAELGTDAATQP